MIRRVCIDCGRLTNGTTRCPTHARDHEQRRQARQWYRIAYTSPDYRRARNHVRRRAKGRCEAILDTGERCPQPGTEAHHDTPLSTARTLAEALAIAADTDRLFWVCAPHNPRGLAQRGRRAEPCADDLPPAVG